MDKRFFEVGVYRIPYKLVSRGNARKLSLRVDPQEGVVVVLPENMPLKYVELFLKEKQEWLLKHWLRIEKQKLMHADRLADVQMKGEIDYLGKKYRLDTQLGFEGRARSEFDGECLKIVALDAIDCKKVLERWYRNQAKAVLGIRLEKYALQMSLVYESYVVKDQKTRWGSCSTGGNLNFNWRLIKAPLEVLDYVVVHELAHLVEMNHSKRFWEIVGKYSREYRLHRLWLKKNGWMLQVG
jgi:predicted metal-dependent hydrolase